MSKSKDKKKVIRKAERGTQKKIVPRTVSKVSGRANTRTINYEGEDLLYGKKNLITMAIGVGVMILGYMMMTGGAQPDSETWDPNIIYNFRRVTLGPFLVLIGIGIEIYAIFQKK